MHTQREQGIALVTILIALTILVGILLTYTTLTVSEMRSVKASTSSTQGFYSAEAGLNLRAEAIRARFIGYLRPAGTGPIEPNACAAGNTGSGDLQCITYTINKRSVKTYVQDTTQYDPAGNPTSGTVEPGDTYAGLNYQQYTYRVRSVAESPEGQKESTLEMLFQTRLVPLFQFATFYKRDLEFHPGPQMVLGGRVHTNGNLYLMAGTSLDINGKTTAGGKIYRKGKDGRVCNGGGGTGPVRITGINLGCQSGDGVVSAEVQAGFNNQLLSGQPVLTVPAMSTLAPDFTGKNNSELWKRADLRVVAEWKGSGYVLRVWDSGGNDVPSATAALDSCNSSPNVKDRPIQVRADSLWDNREYRWLTVMEVNQMKLMDCIQNTGNFTNSAGTRLDAGDLTDGGLVWHFTFQDSRGKDNFGVQISNAATLGTSSNTPEIKGLTIASDWQVFLKGDFNKNNKKPAAVLGDAISILSNSYQVGEDVTQADYRVATATTVNAAFLSGIDDTTSSTGYNGGLQNFPRLHENWSGVTMTYRGSFVSLDNSVHMKGRQSAARYSPPNRDWNYDTDFNDAARLPPVTPRFVYLRQVLFAREY